MLKPPDWISAKAVLITKPPAVSVNALLDVILPLLTALPVKRSAIVSPEDNVPALLSVAAATFSAPSVASTPSARLTLVSVKSRLASMVIDVLLITLSLMIMSRAVTYNTPSVMAFALTVTSRAEFRFMPPREDIVPENRMSPARDVALMLPLEMIALLPVIASPSSCNAPTASVLPVILSTPPAFNNTLLPPLRSAPWVNMPPAPSVAASTEPIVPAVVRLPLACTDKVPPLTISVAAPSVIAPPESAMLRPLLMAEERLRLLAVTLMSRLASIKPVALALPVALMVTSLPELIRLLLLKLLAACTLTAPRALNSPALSKTLRLLIPIVPSETNLPVEPTDTPFAVTPMLSSADTVPAILAASAALRIAAFADIVPGTAIV